jgi:two-component sensor histidine kinase
MIRLLKNLLVHVGFIVAIVFLNASSEGKVTDSIERLLDTSYVLSGHNPEGSLIAVQNAIQLSKQIDNDTLLADSYIEMSYVQSDLGNIPEATEYAFKALTLYEKHGDKPGMATAYMRIAWDKLVIGEYDNVYDYLYESLHLARSSNDSVTLSTVYHMLGAAYNWTNKYQNIASKQDSFHMWLDSAIYYDRKAVEIRRRKNIRGLHSTLNNLGMVLQRKALATGKGFELAEKAYQESLEIRKNNHDTMGMAASYINLAQLSRRKGDLDKAVKYARKGIHLAEEIDYPFHKKLGYNQLSKIYENIGNYDSALFYYKKYTVLQKQAQSTTYKSEIKELETTYEVAKKDQEIELKEQKVQLQRLYLIIMSGMLVMLTILSIYLVNLNQKNKKLSARNELLVKENNHRVKNNLQVISGLLSLQANRLNEKKSKEAILGSQLRIQTIGLIHNRLYGDEIGMVHLDDFLEELNDQILLSFGFDNIKKRIEIIKQKIKPHKATALGLILNELLTNSCKYAFPRVQEPELFIKLVNGDYNRLILTYKDNGPGFNPDKHHASKEKSFGLNLIKLQVEQLNGKASWKNHGGLTFHLDFKYN